MDKEDQEDQEGDEASMDVLPETIDRGKRKVEEEDAPKSREQSPMRPCSFASQPMASQSTNQERSQILSFVIEVPVEEVGVLIGTRRATIDRIQQSSEARIKIESRPCCPGTYRRVELRGTKRQLESAIGLITGLPIDWYPDSVPDHLRLPEPLSYGCINPPDMHPESQPARSYPAHPSYYGDSSTQRSIWGPAPSSSGRRAAPWPGSLFIRPSDLGNHSIQPAVAAQYQANPANPANPSGRHPAVLPRPGSDLPSSSSGNYGYQANSSPMPATSQLGACPVPLEYYTPHVVYHKYPMGSGFYHLAKETVVRPASQPGTYPIPLLIDATDNPPTHATTSRIPPEYSQEIYPAPPLHHNNPIRSEARDEAHSSAMHASTSGQHQRK